MNRTFHIHAPSVSEEILFKSLTGEEFLSGLFEFNVVFLVENRGFDTKQLLGHDITIDVKENHYQKTLNGIVTKIQRVAEETKTKRYFSYEATVKPWLWLATQTNHYKVYQEKTAIEIIRDVLKNYPFKLETNLTGTYREWGYCVQYDETDFNFISRLMEHEGLYYWFKHENGEHRLVIADNMDAHQAVKGESTLNFYPNSLGENHVQPHFYRWQPSVSLGSNQFASTDYNLNKPSVSLEVNKQSGLQNNHGLSLEIYKPMGDYTDVEEGQQLAKIQVEIADAQRRQVRATSNACFLAVGSTVGLEKHPNSKQNQRYLITRLAYDFAEAPYMSHEDHQSRLAVQVELMPSDVQYRHPIVTPKPYTYGPQTARVVGPDGETIWTDEFGRIRVQFHWDRYGQYNEDSSCWVRVSNPWAGGGFGGIQIPRVNEEVIVDFLGGRPDRPIVVGRLYNAENMPPVKLPEQATQSGFHTRTKDGNPDQANSLLFEDDLGQELLKMVAQKDMDLLVKNDSNHSVGGSSATNITGAHQWKFGGKVDKKVQGNATYQHENGHTLKVSGDSKDTVHQRQYRQYTGANAETTAGTESLTVAQEPSVHHYGTGMKQTINAFRNDKIAADKINTLGAGSNVEIGGLLQTVVTSGAMGFFAPIHQITAASAFTLYSVAKYLNLVDTKLVLNAGSIEKQTTISKNKLPATTHNKKVTAFQLGVALMDSKSSSKVTDSNILKVALGGTNDAMSVIKMSAVGLQAKILARTEVSEGMAVSFTGVDLKHYGKKLDKYALKLNI